MKFIKTVNLWDESTIQALTNGQLKLQVGQYVNCGGGVKSRFISVDTKSGTVDVAHGGSNKEVTRKFKQRAMIRRDTVNKFGSV